MQYTSWLKWSIITGLSLVLFVPFIIADGGNGHNIYIPLMNMFFPYITGKNFAFRIIVELIAGLYVLLAIREPKFRPRSSLLMWAVGGLVLWLAFATVFSIDPVKSFWSNFERMDGYITMLHLFALFVVAGAVVTAQGWWERLMQISVGASVLQGIVAVLQAFSLAGFNPSSQSGARADTTFGNATYLAVYMLFSIFITLFLLFKERKSKLAWWLYGVALVLQVAALYFTQTRGAILGLVGGLFVAGVYMALFARGTHWHSVRKWAFGLLAAVVVLVLGFVAIKNTSFVKNNETLHRFAEISITNQPRYLIWHAAFQGIAERPVFGWGQENFNYVFNKFYDPAMYTQEQWFDRAHNEFIDMAVDGGIPALLFYLSLFVFAVWALYKSELELPEQALLVGLLAGYVFNNLFVFDNIVSYIYFFLILAFIHGLSRNKLPGSMLLSKPLGDRAVAVAAPIVVVVVGLCVWGLNGQGLARAQDLINALTPVNLQTGAQKQPQEFVDAFKTVLNEGNLGYQETVEQLFEFSSNTVAPSSLSPDLKQQFYDLTTSAGDKLLAQRKNDARLELFYGVFDDQIGQYQPALAHLQNGLKNSPTKQQILFQTGLTYLAINDIPNAVAQFKKAYDEAPSYIQARVLYASSLYYAGQNAAADKLLTDEFGTVLYDDPQLIQAFYATKQYGRMAGIYAARLAKNPTDAQSMIGHAVTNYFATGNRAAAAAELQKASTDTTYGAQAKSFLDQLNAGTLKP